MSRGRNSDSELFWEGIARGTLVMQRCDSCNRFRFPPMPSCPYCSSPLWAAEEVSGRGTLYSWVVTHHSFTASPGLADGPEVIATVVLAEGPRIFAVLDSPLDDLADGLPVIVAFPEAGDGDEPYPRFIPEYAVTE